MVVALRRRVRRFGVGLSACIALVSLAALVLVKHLEDEPRAVCDAPVQLLADGSARLGPFTIRGFADGDQALVSSRTGEVRLIAEREDRSGDVALRATDCDSGESVKLITIGAAKAISLPSSFQAEAGRNVVILPADDEWFAIISFPGPSATYTLEASENGSTKTITVTVAPQQ